MEGLGAHGVKPRVGSGQIEVVDGFAGPGYALPDERDLALISHVARGQGVLLDPVYTGKAFRGMMSISEQEGLAGKPLFLHTGGGVAIFGYAETLMRQTAYGC